MTIWLEQLLVPTLLEAYLEHGYGFNFGYAVAADSIGSEDSAKDLVAALDLDGPEGPLAGAEVIHTLRFPLMPTDTVYPAMGGTTDEERAVARGDFLEFPPFNGSGVIDLPSDPQASTRRSRAPPRRTRGGSPEERLPRSFRPTGASSWVGRNPMGRKLRPDGPTRSACKHSGSRKPTPSLQGSSTLTTSAGCST